MRLVFIALLCVCPGCFLVTGPIDGKTVASSKDEVPVERGSQGVPNNNSVAPMGTETDSGQSQSDSGAQSPTSQKDASTDVATDTTNTDMDAGADAAICNCINGGTLGNITGVCNVTTICGTDHQYWKCNPSHSDIAHWGWSPQGGTCTTPN